MRVALLLVVENENHCDFVKLREMMLRYASVLFYYLESDLENNILKHQCL